MLSLIMKRDSLSMKRAREIRARNQFKRNFREKPHKHVRKRTFCNVWFRGQTWQAEITEPSTIRYYPEELCFDKNPSETLAAIASTRRNLHKNNNYRLWMSPNLNSDKNLKVKSYIGMDRIREMSTSAALVLAAEYERKLHFMDEPPPLYDLANWDEGVLNKLFQIGFFERFGYSVVDPKKKPQNDNVLTVPFYSGAKAEMEKYDQKLVNLVHHIDPDLSLPADMELSLISALGEAANNSREHAYVSHDFKYPHVNKWWATGAASKSERAIVVSLFDQGVTIPISYPKLPMFSNLKQKLDLFDFNRGHEFQNDARLIQAATVYGKSGRKTPSGELNSKGGYGLPQIKDAINICGSGSLMILSRGGKYLYKVHDGKIHEDLTTYPESLGGTLIEWRVNLSNA